MQDDKKFISEADMLALKNMILERKLAAATLEKYLSEQEHTETKYQLFVHKLYLKYGLNENYSISNTGEIVKKESEK